MYFSVKKEPFNFWSYAYFKLFLSNFFTFIHHKLKTAQTDSLVFLFLQHAY